MITVDLHILLIRDSQVFMLRRYNTGYEDGKYSLPAGHLEENETAKEGALREAKEEIGVMIKSTNLMLVLTLHSYTNSARIALFFQALEWYGEPTNMEPEKCDFADWFPVNSPPENTVAYIREALSMISMGETYGEFGWTHHQN